MIDLLIFAIVAFLEVLATFFLFVFKDILRIAVVLSGIFFLNSIMFLLLGQPILAVVQLFIMVGGVSTFIFVGVAAAEFSMFNYTRFIGMIALSAIFFAVLAYPTLSSASNPSLTNIFSGLHIATSIQQDIGTFYVMLLVLFGVSLSAIMLLKTIGTIK